MHSWLFTIFVTLIFRQINRKIHSMFNFSWSKVLKTEMYELKNSYTEKSISHLFFNQLGHVATLVWCAITFLMCVVLYLAIIERVIVFLRSLRWKSLKAIDGFCILLSFQLLNRLWTKAIYSKIVKLYVLIRTT